MDGFALARSGSLRFAVGIARMANYTELVRVGVDVDFVCLCVCVSVSVSACWRVCVFVCLRACVEYVRARVCVCVVLLCGQAVLLSTATSKPGCEDCPHQESKPGLSRPRRDGLTTRLLRLG